MSDIYVLERKYDNVLHENDELCRDLEKLEGILENFIGFTNGS